MGFGRKKESVLRRKSGEDNKSAPDSSQAVQAEAQSASVSVRIVQTEEQSVSDFARAGQREEQGASDFGRIVQTEAQSVSDFARAGRREEQGSPDSRRVRRTGSRYQRAAAQASRGRRKTVLGYLAGSLGLCLAVAAALFLPELYNSWQDAALVGTVHTENREGIEFIDTSSLDKAGKMKMLSQVTAIDSLGDYSTELYYDGIYEGDFIDSEEYSASWWREKAAQWVDCGLLPGFVLDMVAEESMEGSAEAAYLVTDQGILSIVGVSFAWSAINESEGWYMDWQTLTMYADAETEMLYAAYLQEAADDNSLITDGNLSDAETIEHWSEENSLRTYLAEQIGYDSYQDALLAYQEQAAGGKQMSRAALDSSLYDFAAPCGARSASVTGISGTLSLDVELSYDTFTGKAYRRLISGGGMAVMYGSLCWTGFLGAMTTTDSLLFGDGSTAGSEEEMDFLYSCTDAAMESYLENWGGIEIAEASATSVSAAAEAADAADAD